MTSTEIANVGASNDQLRNLVDFDSAMQLAADLGGEIAGSDVLGDGFTLHDGGKNKDAFVGVPLMIVSWSFSTGDYTDKQTGEMAEFATVRVIRRDGKNEFSKWILNDGSTGICAQLRELSQRNPNVKVVSAPRGLRKSEYIGPNGDPATTYYIDTAASA